jgi:predicted RNA-binding Zn ribbon-like protein
MSATIDVERWHRMTAGSVVEADFDSGAFVLDFVNSVTGRSRGAGRWEDSLPDAFATLSWLRRREALDDAMFRALMRIAASDEVASDAFMVDIRRLRTALGRICSAAIAGACPDATDLEVLEACGSAAQVPSRLVWGRNGLVRARGEEAEAEFSYALRVIAASAEQFLTAERLARVKVCASSTCQWLFLDTSKNGSRRWCRMEVCGNREKGRRRLQRERSV